MTYNNETTLRKKRLIMFFEKKAGSTALTKVSSTNDSSPTAYNKLNTMNIATTMS